ncbi:MAG: glycosyltransferase family 61 protein [Alphaproteobacteria bacterium]|nr:glycosyltransferase family 61 protein [Alphaproteobacteria bacterium]MBV9584316.1 glycosyltransferase family 61 protein [Alphaproteobacteria bacterium]
MTGAIPQRYAEFLHKIGKAETDPRQHIGSPTGCAYFDYSEGQPNLYLLMKFKQALAAEFGIPDGFAVYRNTVARHRDTCLETRAICRHLDFARVRAAAFSEIASGGERFVVDPPAVIGVGNHRPLAAETRSFYVACLPEVRIGGRSEVVHADRSALIDFQGAELARIDDELEFDPAIFSATRDTISTIVPNRAPGAIEVDEAFTLLGAHTDFFGHWMWEYLPRYVAARLSGALPPVPLLIDAHIPRSHRQALDLLLDARVPIVEIPAFAEISVRRLWCASNLTYMPLHERMNQRFRTEYVASPPDRYAPVIEELNRRADDVLGGAAGPPRVFLARRDFRHRRLVNRHKIENLASERGFVVAYPENLDFIDQVRLVRGARYIIAPEGSALFLAYFAPPGLRLCILNHQETEGLAIYNGLLRGRRAQITALTGPQVRKHHERSNYADYEIDERGFKAFLDEWVGD